MDKKTLRRVQLEQLEIAKEIKRVCEKNGIKFFLDSGTLIGAIRHKGFIPWDDDLDIGMLRCDYDRFCEIAPRELDPRFVWQTWDNEAGYPLPFGKVRKRGTVYLERNSKPLSENGFFVDILPYDFTPVNETERTNLRRRQGALFSEILMKCHYTPWIINGKTNLKVRLYYARYQISSLFKDKNQLVKLYKTLTESVPETTAVYQQTGRKFYDIGLFEEVVYITFEDTEMPVISKYHEWLTIAYGDYMTPPPADQRENRHQIYQIDFGDRQQQ